MFDVITVGGATTDVFVRVRGEIEKIHGHLDVCLSIGSKFLIDDLHFDTGGSGTNSAVAFSRLGLKTGWVGKLGLDHNSEEILNRMKKENVVFLGSRGKGMSGYSVILTGLKKDRTILHYKGINNDLSVNDVKRARAKWFYFGSLMGKSFETGKKLVAKAKRNGIPFAFNPSTYLARKGLRYLMPFIDGCSVLVLNLEEARLVAGSGSVDVLLKKLQKYAKVVVITDGARGAFAFDGKYKYTVFPGKVRVVESTGAGDAFASGVVAGMIMKKPLEYCLKLGQAEAEHVIVAVGAKNNLLRRKDRFVFRRVSKCLFR